ncbi:hypothetical protein ACH5RR_016618 [Cinchona calisaya]|uniref:Uncharacterized protein n=1 Tax=Cinchona calisaya TaxID=153742 RepID=A0ABD2ZWH3_9GENT
MQDSHSHSDCEHEKVHKHKNVEQKGRERNHHGFPKEDNPKKDKNDHEPEAYVAPKIDEKVCRDPYCKIHKCRPIFHNKVPSRDSADHPHHTNSESSFHKRGSDGGSKYFNLDQNPFAYDHHPRMPPRRMMEPELPPPPPPGHGLYSGSSYYVPGLEGFDNFDYYGDHGGNYWGWPPM